MSTTTRTSDGSTVVVNIEQNNRPYQIVATLLLCGAVGMVAYALAENGWLEIAATMLTMFLVQLGRLLLANGLISVPRGAARPSEFEGTAGFVRTAAAEFRQWQARSPIWRLAALAALYTACFMTARYAMSLALTVFSNVWIAGATAAFLASLIIFPSLIGGALSKMKSKAAPAQPEATEVAGSD